MLAQIYHATGYVSKSESRACVLRSLRVLVSCLTSSVWQDALMLVRWDLFQVSCLGAEPSVEGDAGRFVLTSRNADGSVVRFQMQASSPEICQAWVNDVGQILDTQRNFLNGKAILGSLLRAKPDLWCFNSSVRLIVFYIY